jgi:hypothetical protein
MSFYSTTGTAATSAAETAKTAAETAKTAAEAAQAAVELLHDDFDDRYLGSKSSDPTVDNDGNALAAGTMYFDTSTSRMRVYSGSAWADITAVQGALITGNNLSDLTDDGAARTNLGLGTAATQNSTAFATAAQADQTVALTDGTGITTSGTYPNFTITNSSPDQTVALTGAGATTISGTYPNFTITSTNTTYSVGDGGLSEINFTSALNSKLAGLETSADVTDTTNVVSALTAGSNITIASDGTIAAPVAGVTYSNSWVDSGNNALLRLTPSSGSAQDLTLAAGSNVSLSPSGSTLTIASTDTTYSVTDGQLSENNFNNTLKSKLDNIEVQADVTDASNVSSAGAVMKTNYSAGSFLYSTSSNNPESKSASQVRGILNVADGANNYVHPTHDGDDIDIDTGGLSGATVISDLDFNVTTDSLGHVTDANASFATRNITLANIGYTGTTDATTNDTDANLRARANHTGTQAQSTIVDLTSDLAAKVATADIQNNLTSTDANKPLSANQGKVLADGKVDAVAGKALSANDYTDADHAKLDGIEASATADQTDAEIEAAYNAQVAQVSSSEKIAGTEAGVRRVSPADLKDMIDTHGSSYTLPTASNSALGGVKVGDTLEISSGVLEVKGLVVSDTFSNASNFTIYTNSDDGCTIKWDSTAQQFTFSNSSISYLSHRSIKIDGGSSSPTMRINTAYIAMSGSSEKYFSGGSRSTDWDLEEGASFETIFNEYGGTTVGYKIEAMRSNSAIVVQIWRI